MKEATGELNGTVFAVVIIAALAVFFFSVIWPMIRGNMNENTKCSAAICEKCPDNKHCRTVKCHIEGDNNNTFECVWRG